MYLVQLNQRIPDSPAFGSPLSLVSEKVQELQEGPISQKDHVFFLEIFWWLIPWQKRKRFMFFFQTTKAHIFQKESTTTGARKDAGKYGKKM